jgi:copper ion binding protein
MSTSDHRVTGMTCGHCAGAVTEEVSKIPGVTGVQVDVAAGRVTVESDQPVAADAVAAAVDEAGYEVVPA